MSVKYRAIVARDDLIVVYGTDGSITDVPYVYDLVRDGAMFLLVPSRKAPPAALRAAKALLYRERDVVSIRIERRNSTHD